MDFHKDFEAYVIKDNDRTDHLLFDGRSKESQNMFKITKARMDFTNCVNLT